MFYAMRQYGVPFMIIALMKVLFEKFFRSAKQTAVLRALRLEL